MSKPTKPDRFERVIAELQIGERGIPSHCITKAWAVAMLRQEHKAVSRLIERQSATLVGGGPNRWIEMTALLAVLEKRSK